MTCLVGGTSGLGLLNATYMATQRVGPISLVGRSGRCLTAVDMQLVAQAGFTSEIVFIKADLSSSSEAKHAVDTTRNGSSKIEGILQAAGLQVRKSNHNCVIDARHSTNL